MHEVSAGTCADEHLLLFLPESLARARGWCESARTGAAGVGKENAAFRFRHVSEDEECELVRKKE